MARYDFTTPRLFVDAPLASGAQLALERGQAHYLINVMRLRAGARVLVFNGRDGEWLAEFRDISRKACSLTVIEQARTQEPAGDLEYWFAPLKQARLDYMVQKAVEMGACSLQPVLTRHGQVAKVNAGRMQANAIEAAEQCGVLTLPGIHHPQRLDALLAAKSPERALIFCDESAPMGDALAALEALAGQPLALLIGPEGGFHEDERRAILATEGAVTISLGPRILRADTAAVAALALVQAAAGDWRGD